MLVKVVAVQMTVGSRLTFSEKRFIFRQKPDFVCLPEYALLGNNYPDYHRAALETASDLEYLSQLSDELGTCLIAGSVVETDGGKLYNTSYLFNRGEWLTSYRKRHPVERELEHGITAGSSNVVIDIDGVRVGMMICGDVFFPEMYNELGTLNCELIFIPTTSAFRPDDSLSQKHERDRKYFLSGSETSNAYVVKVCGVGSIFGRQLQGRSLIAAPWGVVEQIDMPSEQKPRLLVATLDILELRDFKKKRASTKSSEVH